MMALTSLPLFVTLVLRGMPGLWPSRHRFLLCWLVFMQALYPGRKTLEELARWSPAQVTVWRLRRVLTASSWHVHLLMAWWGQATCTTLPPPSNGILYLVGDGSHADKRGPKNPLAPQGRHSEHHPGFVGMRLALLSAHWAGDRLPVALRLIRPKSHPTYQPANALLREMVRGFVPPPWAKRSIVAGDAAYGAQATRKMVRKRDADDPPRRWGVGCAMARTWQTIAGQALKDLVTPVPRLYDQRTRVPRPPGSKGCNTCWTYSKRLWLRHVGAVTVVLSTKGRNVGPQQTQILGTNLAEWTPRPVVSASQRRWPVEQSKRALKTDLGLGAHQVSTEEGRIEQSLGITILAYVWLIRACHQEMLPGKAWSVSQLQHAFRLRVITNQVEHNGKTRLTKARKAA